jgi:aspartyl-tRNA(Asn)/glutamyl-tRNA(Gln) amidotransferase subunit C
MKITEADVEYVSSLANLALTDDERTRLTGQLSRVLDYVESLNRLDTAGIEPTPQVNTGAKHAVRDDRVSTRTGSADATKPVKLFKVPKVITER